MEKLDKDLLAIQVTRDIITKAKKAQEKIQAFSQEKIDAIVKNMVEAAEREAVKLAKLANEETGFGNWEDKVLKNTFASRTLYNYIKDIKTVGIINRDEKNKVVDIAVPVGVIAALIPSTNPTSTTIYKAIIALKAGNAIVFSPHPSAKNCILETVKILKDAAIEAGAPEDSIGCLPFPSVEGTNELMKHKDTALILATGGEAMVKAAYSSGTPAIGVGPGNGPAFIEKSADIALAVKRIIDSKTFDHGVICASEQSIVVESCMKEQVVAELKRQKAYFLNEEESLKLGKYILRENGTMNPQIVGKSVEVLAELAGLSIPSGTKLLISEQTTVGKNNPYSREKLAPILAFYSEENWEKACDRCIELLMNEGKGHTLILHSNNEALIQEFALKKPVSRILINTPGALGGIGGTTNIVPALTLGCGAVGGSATSDNVGPMNLLNIRKLAYGTRELEDLKGAQPTTSEGIDLSEEYVESLIKSIMEKMNI
ncbi:acetaldehyde dehydrogenase (acetylating) [Clostridium formicaceticum]|uniref:Acetaldehyde dehydrogenase (Acetylating) n=1 Tax=Clostridium formicaceticum TaxID=1497 RepID=A0AAC9RLR4_9CLOT|nr:acetaldehyde dehydrogenase (acetylating) [Clostridium formicaceticum]AOY77125.1 acetaldehyde dehydrogenase (acetylating) [Clostridium formicaceticum]ARE87640.1 Aldehyde-alcohol dehydrogenase [Clostridium formicaceticum]